MEKLTSTRRRGAGKTLDVSGHVEETQIPARYDTGDRQAGATGSGAQARPDASFEELVKAVQDFKAWKDSVAMAFHPHPTVAMIQTAKGWVRVAYGEAAYQLNSGELIKV